MPNLYTIDEKIKIVIQFKESGLQPKVFVNKLNITYATLLNWTHIYDEYGVEGFKRSNSSYLEEIAELRKENKELKKELELNKVKTEMFKRLEEIIDRKK